MTSPLRLLTVIGARQPVARMIEGGGMELDEFHVFYGAFGAIDHGDAVTCGNQRVGSVTVYGFAAAGCHDSHF